MPFDLVHRSDLQALRCKVYGIPRAVVSDLRTGDDISGGGNGKHGQSKYRHDPNSCKFGSNPYCCFSVHTPLPLEQCDPLMSLVCGQDEILCNVAISCTRRPNLLRSGSGKISMRQSTVSIAHCPQRRIRVPAHDPVLDPARNLRTSGRVARATSASCP